jgi:hypothetical protein
MTVEATDLKVNEVRNYSRQSHLLISGIRDAGSFDTLQTT